MCKWRNDFISSYDIYILKENLINSKKFPTEGGSWRYFETWKFPEVLHIQDPPLLTSSIAVNFTRNLLFNATHQPKKNYIYIMFSRILLVWFIHFHLLTLIWTHTCISLNFSLHNQDATYSKNFPLWLCLNLKLNWPGWNYKSKKYIKLQSRSIFQCHFYYSLKNKPMLSVLHCIGVLMINEDVWQRMLNLFFTLEKRVTYTR